MASGNSVADDIASPRIGLQAPAVRRPQFKVVVGDFLPALPLRVLTLREAPEAGALV